MVDRYKITKSYYSCNFIVLKEIIKSRNLIEYVILCGTLQLPVVDIASTHRFNSHTSNNVSRCGSFGTLYGINVTRDLINELLI